MNIGDKIMAQININVDEDLREKLKVACALKKVTAKQVIVEAIKKFIADVEEENK